MSSDRRRNASRLNGTKSHGPSTPAGKLQSSQNALRHGLLAACVVLECESRENFESLIAQHVERFQPTDGVEFGMIEEMCSAYWRLRRAWALETRMFDKQIANQPGAVGVLDSMTAALDNIAASPSLALLHRYEARLHLMYQRALRNLLMLQKLNLPNEPSPISEHPAAPPDAPPDASPQSPQPADSSAMETPALAQSMAAPQSAAQPLPDAPVATDCPAKPSLAYLDKFPRAASEPNQPHIPLKFGAAA